MAGYHLVMLFKAVYISIALRTFFTDMFRKTDQGALAQYARVPADALVNRPPNVTPVQAAGLTLTGLTAYDIVFKTANVLSGQSVFVNGGSTTVGAFAIQLAKIRGARVVASASGSKEQFVRDLGADEVCICISISVHQLHGLLSLWITRRSIYRNISPKNFLLPSLTTSLKQLALAILPSTHSVITICPPREPLYRLGPSPKACLYQRFGISRKPR